MITTAIATKFVKWDIPELDTLKGSKVYQLREKVNAGEKLNREEKNWIAENVNRNSYFKNAIPLGGYRFDFSEILKTYIVKQYGSTSGFLAIFPVSIQYNICLSFLKR